MRKPTRSPENETHSRPFGEVSGLLRAWSERNRAALDRLTPIVYEETAEVLKVSPVTVMRDWSTAKAWLYRELVDGHGPADGL
jgi:hypothetical protein